jgi:uncharacterized protein (DUF305 family)
MKKIVLIAVAGLMLASAAAIAQMAPGQPPSHGGGHMMGPGMMHGGMKHGGAHGEVAQPKGDTSPSSLAFQGINAKMHKAMSITYTGNADTDFVNGMIPHHEGAVDMAKTVLAFGKDPEVRKLAEAIIKAQESEIALMREWLKKQAQ